MVAALPKFPNDTSYILDVFIPQDLKIYVKFLTATKVKKIIGIAKRLRLRSSKRLTSYETNIASSQAMYMILLNSSVCPSRAGTGRGGEASLVE